MDELTNDLLNIGGIKFGDYQLKSGVKSPIYFDFRVVISHPNILKSISNLIMEKWKTENLNFDLLCGIPYTALPIATVVSTLAGIPQILKRKEAKSYGTKQLVEGDFKTNDRVLLIEDVVTTGSSVIETAQVLRSLGLVITHVICILDRGQGAKENLRHEGIILHSILQIGSILQLLRNQNKITSEKHDEVIEFLGQNLTQSDLAIRKLIKELEPKYSTEHGKRLLQIMAKKKSNLCISFDLEKWWTVLHAIERLAAHLVLVKTHVDTYDFESYEQMLEFRRKIVELSETHSFLILEDHKFGDIGNTVKKQLESKPYEIWKWAHMVTAHGIPGPGILSAISSFKNLSTILIREMSSAGTLTSESYAAAVYELVKGKEDVVTGFVSQSSIPIPKGDDQNKKFLQFTPGVSISASEDSLGQQYVSINEAIEKRGADIIIVGRGIVAENPEKQVELALQYQTRGWNTWVKRMLQQHTVPS